ncbi:peroxiredoxin family protein [Pseudodesulfovibrio sediminis]|uniref:Thioredoxin domain-containing protein n=1 Tax=Pseudodesulfovibrio sediminis TaxID=2810563 RepID=A0ABN6EW28_9BACT|nr:redoxin domain-containing protein [Pseudodesulfovibrio sediminis]BCS89733.1 hypothetical protein PSDVSF_29750 [Pseudodesulfovibrio sediminis]
MKRLALSFMALLLMATPVLAADIFPDLELKGGISADAAAYLGVSGSQIKVSSIQADYLFVEIYSMYCPICQRDAPRVNTLFQEVAAAGRDNVKFIGVAAGNTNFEVNFYRKKFSVLFPLFEDENFSCHKAVGGVGTPSFYLVDLKAGRQILFFQEGAIKDEAAMLKMILDTTAP